MVGLQGSIIELAIFIIINSITPEPNNLMLLQGGLKRGYWGCRWHMLGISFGLGVMLWLSYWGMATLIVNHPNIMLIIRLLGTSYLLWLAYQMSKSDLSKIVQQGLQNEVLNNSSNMPKQRFGELPLTFWQAVLFQWLNPKVWTMTVVAPSLAIFTVNIFTIGFTTDLFTTYSESGALKFGLNNFPLLLMCMLINLSCISFWSAGGQWLRKLVNKPTTMKIVHIIIVLTVIYCAIAMWF